MSENELSVKDAIKGINKKCGPKVAEFKVEKGDLGRSPSGVFPLDYILGGGIPNGKVCIIYGKPSSGKSILALKSIAHYQKRYPDKVCVMVDAEGHYDSEWARTLGVDTDSLLVVRANYGEQYVDVMDELVKTEDIGLMVLDSVSNLMPLKEIDSSAEDSMMGKPAQIQTTMYRRFAQTLNNKIRDTGFAPPIVVINQVRSNFDAGMYGPKEGMAGAKMQGHAGLVIIHIYGNAKVDHKYGDIPCYNEMTAKVEKYKNKILATTVKFQLALIPHKGLNAGEVDDSKFIMDHLEDMGVMTPSESGTGFIIEGEEFRIKRDIREKIKDDFEFSERMKGLIIKHAIETQYKSWEQVGEEIS